MLELTKGKIVKENKKYRSRFSPKYEAFDILQNKIEDVVKKSTQMWKLIYGLTTIKVGEEDPFEGRNNKEEDEDKEEKIDKEKVDTTVEETQKKKDEMTIVEKQQEEKNVEDTQMPMMSPPHNTSTLVETITIKDVPNRLAKNISPLTIEDLKKILD